MPKMKIKKKIAGKKKLSKTKRKVGVLYAKKTFGKLKGRKKIKDLNTDIIFDSTVGKTDTLFVDKPE